MTTTLFKITPTPPTTLELPPGGEGKFSFTVESLAAPDAIHDVMLRTLLVEPSGESREVDWLIAGPQRTLTMSGGKTETVHITVKLPATIPAGERTLKLVVADKDRPNDVHVASQPVTLAVVAGTLVVADDDGHGWLIAAIIGALMLAGGGVVAWKLVDCDDDPSPVGRPCGADAGSTCPEDLVCAHNKCLLAGGATCARDADCASGECTQADVCALPLGDACDPVAEKAPCPTDSECDPDHRRCLKPVGRSCTSNDQCVTLLCVANVCTAPLRSCTVDADCDARQRCIPVPREVSRVATKGRCAWGIDHTCNKDVECTSLVCHNGICSESRCRPACERWLRCNNDPRNPRCVGWTIPFEPRDPHL
jgi:hypothetical protein